MTVMCQSYNLMLQFQGQDLLKLLDLGIAMYSKVYERYQVHALSIKVNIATRAA